MKHAPVWMAWVGVIVSLIPSVCGAEVKAYWGPTDIPKGECLSAKDLTVRTDRFAVAFAVGTTPGWGVPAGTIMDATLVQDGKLRSDKLVFFDFLPNGWLPWPAGAAKVEVIEEESERVVVSVFREYGPMQARALYTFTSGSDVVAVEATVTNPTGAVPVTLESGFSLVTHSGEVFAPFCKASQGAASTGPAPPASAEAPPKALPGWAIAFGTDWAISMVVPGSTICRGGSTYKDLLQARELGAASQVKLHASLLLLPSPDLAPVLEASTQGKGVTVGGKAAQSDPSKGPTVVLFEKEGQLFGWTVVNQGRYEAVLPAGRYQSMLLTPEMQTSGPLDFQLVEGTKVPAMDFEQVLEAGVLEVRLKDVKGEAGVPVRVRVTGGIPGGPLAFPTVAISSPERPGVIRIRLPAGQYQIYAAHGAPFLSAEVSGPVEVVPGIETRLNIKYRQSVDHTALGIRCSDLHHHSDQMDARTPPELVALAQAAAGLHYLFVSDHDTTVNHDAMAKVSETLGIPLIPSVEVSTSWGHFNVYPWPLGKLWPLVDRDRTAKAIFALAHENGADVQVNHPFAESSAYFTTMDQNQVPGGTDWGFQYAELNGHDLLDDTDWKTLERVQQFWTQGKRIFLSGGSDNHDVRSGKPDEVAGCIRTCVYGARDGSVAAYFEQLRQGQSFVSTGPTVVTTPLPGQTTPRPSSKQPIRIQAWAPLGVKEIHIDSNVAVPAPAISESPLPTGEGGVRAEGRTESPLPTVEGRVRAEGRTDVPTVQTVEVDSLPEGALWISVRVVDMAGNVAVTNPIWIR